MLEPEQTEHTQYPSMYVNYLDVNEPKQMVIKNMIILRYTLAPK